ncbi:hypothetical protein CYMTET_48432 [Cymbomonas tetramitiformis]|uniref:Uncharacterized protein n=1 Tax=Cymbomonas tetramitiformis TaxID=36881 RepID=A0AAE0BTX2_9CHLO|nr:hypothetical protein CYMTET_48432 [Cymbomonas tetramitiformis]
MNQEDLVQALFQAAWRGDAGALRSLLPQLKDRQAHPADKDGYTLVHCAASGGHADAAEFLLRSGLSPDVQDKFGNTPAHVAATKGTLEVLEVLAKHGASVNTNSSKFGWTPLHSAAFWGKADVVSVLLRLGADSRIKSGAGQTPWAVSQTSAQSNEETTHRLMAATTSSRSPPRATGNARHFRGTVQAVSKYDNRIPSAPVEKHMVDERPPGLVEFQAKTDPKDPLYDDEKIQSSNDIYFQNFGAPAMQERRLPPAFPPNRAQLHEEEEEEDFDVDDRTKRWETWRASRGVPQRRTAQGGGRDAQDEEHRGESLPKQHSGASFSAMMRREPHPHIPVTSPSRSPLRLRADGTGGFVEGGSNDPATISIPPSGQQRQTPAFWGDQWNGGNRHGTNPWSLESNIHAYVPPSDPLDATQVCQVCNMPYTVHVWVQKSLHQEVTLQSDPTGAAELEHSPRREGEATDFQGYATPCGQPWPRNPAEDPNGICQGCSLPLATHAWKMQDPSWRVESEDDTVHYGSEVAELGSEASQNTTPYGTPRHDDPEPDAIDGGSQRVRDVSDGARRSYHNMLKLNTGAMNDQHYLVDREQLAMNAASRRQRMLASYKEMSAEDGRMDREKRYRLSNYTYDADNPAATMQEPQQDSSKIPPMRVTHASWKGLDDWVLRAAKSQDMGATWRAQFVFEEERVQLRGERARKKEAKRLRALEEEQNGMGRRVLATKRQANRKDRQNAVAHLEAQHEPVVEVKPRAMSNELGDMGPVESTPTNSFEPTVMRNVRRLQMRDLKDLCRVSGATFHLRGPIPIICLCLCVELRQRGASVSIYAVERIHLNRKSGCFTYHLQDGLIRCSPRGASVRPGIHPGGSPDRAGKCGAEACGACPGKSGRCRPEQRVLECALCQLLQLPPVKYPTDEREATVRQIASMVHPSGTKPDLHVLSQLERALNAHDITRADVDLYSLASMPLLQRTLQMGQSDLKMCCKLLGVQYGGARQHALKNTSIILQQALDDGYCVNPPASNIEIGKQLADDLDDMVINSGGPLYTEETHMQAQEFLHRQDARKSDRHFWSAVKPALTPERFGLS